LKFYLAVEFYVHKLLINSNLFSGNKVIIRLWQK